MASLPAVFVELKATTASFTSSFDAAKKTVNDFSSQSTSGLQKLEQVGKVAFIGLAGAATAFGGLAVKAALDGQAAHAQLVQAVQNSGTAFDSVGGKVDSMSDRFAKLGFENDQVEAALARMVTATGSTSVAMNNMGLAADLARARHISLEDASNALGKVLAGNMRGMQAFGLSTKDAGGNALTTAEAIAELNDRFGGAALAAAGTYAGGLQALNAEWHNMTEAVGNMLLPALADLAGKAADALGWLEKHREVAIALGAAIGGPLVLAMSAYIAKQAIAFGGSVISTIQKIGATLTGLLVPALEETTAAEANAAAMESYLTLGLSVAAGALGVWVMNHTKAKSAVNDASTAVDSLTGGVDGLAGAEGGLVGPVDAATKALQAQKDLYDKLAGDTSAQQSQILSVIGDFSSLKTATDNLKNSTGANSEVTKQATQHTKDLAAANKDVKDAADAVTSALNKQSAAKKKLDDLMKPQSERNITDAVDAHEAANDRLTRANIGVKDKTNDLTAAIAEYGAGSEQATLANLDLNDALREQHDAANAVTDSTQQLGDAQRPTIGTTDEIKDATSEYTDATNAVTDAQGKQKDAQGKLNDVLGDSGAVKAARDDTKNLADNTAAWEQATLKLNDDWGNLKSTLAANPDLLQSIGLQLKTMKDNLPSGADAKPLQDLLNKIGQIGNVVIGWQALPAGIAGPPSPVFGQPGQTASQIIAWMQLPAGIAGPPTPVVAGQRAAGGPVLPGQTYVVGEDGPEVLRMGSMAGSVIPNSVGGGFTWYGNLIINGAGNLDENTLADKVRDKLLAVGRNNVDLWGRN